MKLAYSAATEEVSRMALAWVEKLDEILPKIAEIGYEGVEFQIRDAAEIDLGKLKRQVRDAGLTVTAISTGTFGQIDKLYVVDPDESVRKACTERFKAALELAGELGVDTPLARLALANLAGDLGLPPR